MKAIYLCVAAFLFFVTIDAHADCKEDNWDVWKVAKALQQGLSKETLLLHLDGSRKELEPGRMVKIRGLIEEVYELEQSQAESFWKAHHKECPAEEET